MFIFPTGCWTSFLLLNAPSIRLLRHCTEQISFHLQYIIFDISMHDSNSTCPHLEDSTTWIPVLCTLFLGLFFSVSIFHMSDLKDRLLKSPDNSEWLLCKHIACNSCKSVFVVTANLYVSFLKECCWHGTIKICGWVCVQWLTKCLCCY